jgi:hypothetical protein
VDAAATIRRQQTIQFGVYTVREETILGIEIALTLHDQKQSMCADVTINDGSKEIHTMRKHCQEQQLFIGKMYKSQRVFTAIMKHNRVFFRRLVCSMENQVTGSLDSATAE